jgi:hypothetical protein
MLLSNSHLVSSSFLFLINKPEAETRRRRLGRKRRSVVVYRRKKKKGKYG